MDIERINDNTLKLVISYKDIEERGFTKDEIWFNRDKGEELFWVMMDEIDDDQFEVNGPLWIQVVAKEVGLELTVTVVNAPHELFNEGMLDVQNKGSQFANMFESDPFTTNAQDFETDTFQLLEDAVFELESFDDLIPLAKSMPSGFDEVNELYVYEGRYYLYIDFTRVVDVELQQDFLSPILEYAKLSSQTIHVLREYGKAVMEGDCFAITREHF
ncbi:adaptor protein MecA [Kurthia sp. YJT4]|uniref:adaptor protein MecA n=1 Tax=Kurthia sp. YJT4 TaxID=3049086 RepID=UPI0025501EDA|nr:adaptor protein MecA [Kurthia sp. YJT4]WIL39184.1 adaptor protein MecA [Kurthia sp. YJT4]